MHGHVRAQIRLYPLHHLPDLSHVIVQCGHYQVGQLDEHAFLLHQLYAFKDIVEEFLNALREELVKDPRFTAMADKDRDELLNKMWIFTHGFAALICVGLIEDNGNKHIINTLLDMGSVVISAALAKSQK